jgi:hypothetical protein
VGCIYWNDVFPPKAEIVPVPAADNTPPAPAPRPGQPNQPGNPPPPAKQPPIISG